MGSASCCVKFCCPSSCHLVVRQDLAKSWSMHICIVLLALKNVLSLLLLTLCLSTCSFAPQTLSSLYPFSSSEKPDGKKFLAQAQEYLISSPASSQWHFAVRSTSAPISLPIDCNICFNFGYTPTYCIYFMYSYIVWLLVYTPYPGSSGKVRILRIFVRKYIPGNQTSHMWANLKNGLSLCSLCSRTA